MSCAAIIPCRYASTRFPGKPLAMIGGKPMMWHVYQRAIESGVADQIYIATDDERIASVCRDLKLDVIMTASTHFAGTDRVAEAALKVAADLIVNVQGDEPLINPEAIAAVVNAMQSCTLSDVAATNGCAILDNEDELRSNNVVKVVKSGSGFAIGFSRYPIPFPRNGQPVYRRQMGLYCFRKDALALFSRTEPGPIERAESVEMLRFLEADQRVLMIDVEDHSIPVDTPEDLERARAEMTKLLMV
jgi:3-deoxy-manno-octulosonate cytidylyltransferase (CMP-KDO synthetase)